MTDGNVTATTPNVTGADAAQADTGHIIRAGGTTEMHQTEGADVTTGGEQEAAATATEVDVTPLQEQLDALKSELDSARAALKQAAAEKRKMRQSQMSDPELVEEIQKELDEAQAALEQKELESAERQEQLEKEFAIKGNRLDMAQKLVDSGLPSSDSTIVAEWLTTDDAVASNEKVSTYISIFKKAVKAAVKAETRQLTKENSAEPANGKADSSSGKEKISVGAAAAKEALARYTQSIGGNI